MTQTSCIATEFPAELSAIKSLRSQSVVFNEICDDLELLGRDIALFSGLSVNVRNQKQDEYRDTQLSYQALRQEISEFLVQSHDHPDTGGI